MSVDQASEDVKHLGGLLDDEPAPTVNRAIERDLARFEEHKSLLLEHLSKFEPSDDQTCWSRLVQLAQVHFLREATTPTVERKRRLQKLEKTLDRARSLAEQVRQDHVGSELISRLFDGTLPREPRGTIVLNDDGSLRVDRFPEIDFKEMVASLSAHQGAVRRAVQDGPPGDRATIPVCLPASSLH